MGSDMKRIIVQIYEIQDAREVPPLLASGVDHVGTVIHSPDRSQWPPWRETVEAVKLSEAKSIIIPLFSEPSDVLYCISYFKPHLVQFCEALSGARINLLHRLAHLQEEVKEKFPQIGIVRSIGIPRPGAAKKDTIDEIGKIIDVFAPWTDYLLLDTVRDGKQPVSGFVGITGEICDWALARHVVEISSKPVILAGGLGPHNVAEAIRYVRPAGVDSCSHTNARDENGKPLRFRKDMKLVSLFVREVRRMEKED